MVDRVLASSIGTSQGGYCETDKKADRADG
nr:MAG TPA: hypothetical protein [Caudoviricetes sp.]